MVKLFSHTHRYDDAWPTVALAFFLRYPNRYASHVVSTDVLSRTLTSNGTLLTTRLILKRGALPAWFPRSLMSRSESWIVEESEVDIDGRVLRCKTKNLDHVKIMEVVESTELTEMSDGSTLHKTEARFVSGLGWGLKRRIEEYSASRFKANIEKSRLGLTLVARLLREYRLQSLPPPFGNRLTHEGGRWSYSDIHAAASTSADSVARSSHEETGSYHSQSKSPSYYEEDERECMRRPTRSSTSDKSLSSSSLIDTRKTGWSTWLWPPKN